jgi:PKD repeat protein
MSTADETNPAVNFPLDTSGDYSERPVVAYSPEAAVYLAAWNDRDDGGVYARRYAGAMPPVPSAGFTAVPSGGVVPLAVVFTDISTGTGSPTVTGSAPLSHTYVTTGSFSTVLVLSLSKDHQPGRLGRG